MQQVWCSPVGAFKFAARNRSPSSGERRLSPALVAAAVASCLAHGIASAEDLPKYEVTGFRGAAFGMTEREVQPVITRSLGVKAADIVKGTNPVEGTTVLTAEVSSLDPGPGPARVAYIFGHHSKKLIQVNVIWGEGTAKDKVDPNAMFTAGTRLQRYFASFAWRKDTTRAGIPVGPNTLVLFAGEDEKTGAVRLILDGVKYQIKRQGHETSSPEPAGPPKLIINYIADRDNPDIAKIDKGKF